MKIKQEHYEKLVQMMEAARAKMDKPMDEWVKTYQDLGRSNTRFAWDWFWALDATDRKDWIKSVYDYANDDHITTALNKAMKEMGVVYVEPKQTRITPGSPMMCEPIKVVSNLDTAQAHRETPNQDAKEEECTIWIAPGNSQCRVYLIPYPMRPNQSPRDLAERFQQDWKHVALLDHELKVVYSEEGIRGILHEIEGQMGGTFFSVPRSDVAGMFPEEDFSWCVVETQDEDTPEERDVVLVKNLTKESAEKELSRQINQGAENAYIGSTEDYRFELNEQGDIVEIKKEPVSPKKPSVSGFDPSM